MRARIIAEKRLDSNQFHGQLILLWYSFVGVATSIYYLVYVPHHKIINLFWVIYSIAIFFVSSYISQSNFQGRADQMKQCHLALKELYYCSEQETGYDALSKKYLDSLKMSGNHKSSDYLRAMCNAKWYGEKIDMEINWYMRLRVYSYFLKKYLLLTICYSMPIFLFILIFFLKWN